MYTRLKKAFAVLTMLFITLIGLLFIKSYENEMFAGYREVIVVEESRVDFSFLLDKIVKENNLILAKRIVEPSDNETGKLRNTYFPIGADKLPRQFPIQQDPELLESSSDNSLYVIISGNMDAESLTSVLRAENNRVRVMPTNYEFALVRLLLSIPQSLLIVLALLVAYASLILTEHIAGIREVGIRRLSGEGKHQICLKQTYRESVFLGINLLVLLLLVPILLSWLNLFSIMAFFIISLPLIIWTVLLLILNFSLSNIFYYILQQQPIVLSVKGKAPMNLVFLVVLGTQMVTLFSVMYCVFGLAGIGDVLNELQIGEKEWERYGNYYQITSLDDGGSIKEEQRINFYKDIEKTTVILYRADMLDNKAMSDISGAEIYEPTPEMISNVMYVNANYISEAKIQLSEESKKFIKQMVTFDKLILIPESQKANYMELSKKWIKVEERGFVPDDVEVDNPHPNAKIRADLYGGGDLFTFPVFSQTGRLTSHQIFLDNPILVIEKLPYDTVPLSNLLFNNQDDIVNLIQKHGLAAGFGSLTNGLQAVKNKIVEMRTKQTLILVSAILSIISSSLLFVLMNLVYFFQGRRVFLIERLAGKSFLMIHKVYLLTVILSHLLCFLVAYILRMDLLVCLTPIFYLVMMLLIFCFQLSIEKRAHILYLKGE